MSVRNSDSVNKKHLIIDGFKKTNDYVFPSKPIKKNDLRQDYYGHARHLLKTFTEAFSQSVAERSSEMVKIQDLPLGAIFELRTLPLEEKAKSTANKISVNFEAEKKDVFILKTERLADRSERALLFIPDDQIKFFEQKIVNYGHSSQGDRNALKDMFETIDSILYSNVAEIFEVDLSFIDQDERIWWEVWVRKKGKIVNDLRRLAEISNINVDQKSLNFPDTEVLFFHASLNEIFDFAKKVPGAIFQVRKSSVDINDFIDTSTGVTQHDYVNDLLPRIQFPSDNSPVVCVLDSGVNADHPLIKPALRSALALDANWGTDDHVSYGGHGTPIIGLALYGDLIYPLQDQSTIVLNHAVESTKLLAPKGFAATPPNNYGVATQGAVSLAETARPNQLRSFCLASSTEEFSSAAPSTWSSAIDQITSGSMPGDPVGVFSNRPKRLLQVATGNFLGGDLLEAYKCHQIEDPAQSWNALTVGGVTSKDQMPTSKSHLKPVATPTDRSPFSLGTTKPMPSDLTPIKPEVTFEAGNMVYDSSNFCGWNESVSLLSTGSSVVTQPLTPFYATSAAVGVAGKFMGELQAALPDLWPETHRALAVDSARWTDPVAKRFLPKKASAAHWKTMSRSQVIELFREHGYGVPNIERAISSAHNDASMIAQAEIQPYVFDLKTNTATFNEMHYYKLPWPKGSLEVLENEIVTMKVTLSYFIEPNLNGKAGTRPETYRSFGLRFAMKKRAETDAQFMRRISANGERLVDSAESEANYWLLGPKAIQAGSLHCDIWRGRAIELAAHDSIVIFPVGGWWKSHVGQKRGNDKARYSLVISINAENHQVDLYSEIEALVNAQLLV